MFLIVHQAYECINFNGIRLAVRVKAFSGVYSWLHKTNVMDIYCGLNSI